MRFLIISLVFFICFGCKTYSPAENIVPQETNEIVQNTYFLDEKIDYVYKAQIEVFGNNLGGIFVIKKIDETTKRIAFTTEFGNKLLDFTLSNGEFTLNYVVDELNKKIILSVLESDLKLLLQQKFEVSNKYILTDKTIFKSKIDKSNVYLFFDKDASALSSIVLTNKRKEKIKLSFKYKSATFADQIEIKHHNFPLKMSLNQIVE